jgi:hypothetical protein
LSQRKGLRSHKLLITVVAAAALSGAELLEAALVSLATSAAKTAGKFYLSPPM